MLSHSLGKLPLYTPIAVSLWLESCIVGYFDTFALAITQD